MQSMTYNGLECLLDLSEVDDEAYQKYGLLRLTDEAVIDAFRLLGHEVYLADAEGESFYVLTLKRSE